MHFNVEGGKEIVERLKATPEVSDFMRSNPGAFIGFLHAEAVPFLGPSPDNGEPFSEDGWDAGWSGDGPDGGGPAPEEYLDGGFADDVPDDGYSDDDD
ncbi:MAG: hypothetical protein LBQ12_10135 [Deltaproteobacteria bacterium]|jgi:hypothetical protein|nr:hypothetical protein [Deltaproteobacteria bacterium]